MLTTELFIQNVRKFPCLWDMNNITYRDMTRKEKSWEIVARECNMLNGLEAKAQWKRLRDCHREALRRRKISAGQGARFFSPWKYEQLMDFLLPHTENKDSPTNFPIDPDGSGDISTECLLPPPSRTEPLSKNRAIDDTVTEEREKIREERQKERDKWRRQIIETNRIRRDALSDLFSSLCQKTRDLPKYLQLRVQREIFESVARAEEEALTLEQTMNESPRSSTSSYDYLNPTPGSSAILQPKEEEEELDEKIHTIEIPFE
ncbi:uncharacterized protein ACR2FA_008242 [Aphomia sociella]